MRTVHTDLDVRGALTVQGAPVSGGSGAGATLYTLGNDVTTGTPTSLTSNRVYVQKITVTEESLLASISVYIEGDNSGQPASLAVGVWADVSNAPQHLLAFPQPSVADSLYLLERASQPSSPARWLSLPVGMTVSPGDYWIGFVANDPGNLKVYKTTGAAGSSQYFTPGGAYRTDIYPPSNWPPNSSTDLWSMRASLVKGGGSSGGGSAPYTADLGAITADIPVVITHGLGTYDVSVTIINKDTAAAGGGSGEIVWSTISINSTNAISITFAENAVANKYRVIVSTGSAGGGGTATPNDADIIIASGIFN